MATVAIIQARMGSTRLPGKVLVPFAGQPALAHCVARTAACPAIDEVVVATTTNPEDDAIVALCAARGWRWSRGAEHDVLDRYVRAARDAGAEHVIRITSDCPLTDPAVLGDLLARYGGGAACDYASTSYPRASFPIGIAAEVVRMDALERAWREDDDPRFREHVTPYVYRHPERFRLTGLACDGDHAHHRWTLDTPADAELLRLIFDALPPAATGWREVLALVERNPGWSAINRDVAQRQAPGASG